MRNLSSYSASLLVLAFTALPAAAQDTPQVPDTSDGQADPGAVEITDSEIIVTAPRYYGQVLAPQPPILTLDETDIASYGVSSLSDLIDALAPQTGSGRGRGDGQPVILLNGQRISSFREMRNIPPEAVRRMEVLPEEVALRYGYRADQRVINFILKDNFAARTIEAEGGVPTDGGFLDTEFEASLLRIDGDRRVNLNAKAEDTSLLTESERDVIQQPGSAPSVSGDPDPAAFRSLVADSRDLRLTGSFSTGLGKGAQGGSLSVNGAIQRTDTRSLSGLDAVVLTAPNGTQALRTLGDPLARDNRTVTVSGGAGLNKPLGAWQLSATVDASLAETETAIDRRADTSALVAAAAAGTLAIDGALPAVGQAGFDSAFSRNTSVTSLATLVGQPVTLPAGDVAVTISAGFAHSAIRSSDTRTIAGRVSLSRDDASGGINVGVPIASRSRDVLAAIGDLSLNLSANVDHLSDFGTLTDYSTGLTWAPVSKLTFQATYIVDEDAPALTDLGNPLVQTFNVPVFDFTRNQTTLVTVTSGGNPALRRETRRDIKLSANWELPILRNSNLLVEYFRNNSDDVTASFPVLTPAIEAAFPGRVTRDASGVLIAIDRRPVTFDQTRGSRLRYGVNVGGTIGKPDPAAERGARGMGAGGPRGAGMGGPGGGGPRIGGGGSRGGPGGGMFGGGNGQGRWNLSVYHTLRFDETVRIAAGGPVLDLLDGDALTGGGVARHALEAEGGLFYRGFGLRFNGSWAAPTRIRATGLPGSSDLRFGSVLDLDLRAFVNFDQQKSVVTAVPFLKGARMSLGVRNVLDSRQRVTDNTGAVPISYQADLIDPRGRVVSLEFRKAF